MNRRHFLLTAAAGPILLPGLARAGIEDSEAIPFANNLVKVPAGSWASYRMSFFEGGAPNDMRLSLVRKTRQSALWELSFLGPEKTKVIVQIETDVDAGSPGDVKSRLSRFGDRKPEVPPTDPKTQRQWFRVARAGKAAAKKALVVPAGTFRCHHLVQPVAPGFEYEFWIDPRVFPTGVVRFQKFFTGGNGVRSVQETWDLLAMGRGAKVSFPPLSEAHGVKPGKKT